MQLINDFVIKEDMCNLACDYCMTSNWNFLKEKRTARERSSSANTNRAEPLDYLDNRLLRQSIDSTLDSYDKYFNAPILKISGGEIFLIRNIAKLVARESTRYDAVQILTNGTLLESAVLDELKGLGNVSFQVSLDGHTPRMNRLRTRSDRLHDRLLTNIDSIAANHFPLEIYCVITKQNVEELPSFLDYLSCKFGSAVCLIPFPARHASGEPFLPEKHQLWTFEKILADYDKYRDILPSDRYLKLIYDHLLNNEKRSIRCYVPFIMMQSFEDGSVTPCPYNWVQQSGNLVSDPVSLCGSYGVSTMYHMRTTKQPWAPFCKTCHTDSILFSLYFDGAISLHELVRNRPVLQSQPVRKRLKTLEAIFHSKRSGD